MASGPPNTANASDDELKRLERLSLLVATAAPAAVIQPGLRDAFELDGRRSVERLAVQRRAVQARSVPDRRHPGAPATGAA